MGPRPNFNEFLTNRNLVALRIPASDLPGILRKSITVPTTCGALVGLANGRSQYAPPGQKVAVKGDILIAKSGAIDLKMLFPDLRSEDGFAVTVTCTLKVHVHTDRSDLLRDFARVLLRAHGATTISDLKTHLAAELRRALHEYVSARVVADLHRKPPREDWLPVICASLERHVFATGIGFDALADVTFASYDYENRVTEDQRRKDDAKRAQERVEAKEQRVRRLEALLKEEDIQALLNRIPDERVRSIVYATLMEEDTSFVTREDLVRKLQDAGEEVRELLFRALEGVEGAGSAPAVPVEHAEEVFLSTGDLVVQVSATEPTLEPVTFRFPEPLRSARWAETGFGPAILAGGKGRVFVLPLSRAAERPMEFPLESAMTPRGGVNAVAVHGEWVFATHSEFGVARWSMTEPGRPAERMFDEATARQRTTRGACVDGDLLYFATGPEVYRVPMNGAMKAEKLPTPADTSVTALAAGGSMVFAGTADGSLVAWKNHGSEPATVLVRRKDPIVALRVARIRQVPHVLYTAHDLAVRARVVGMNLETSYESGGITLSFMDASSDLVCAVDATGGRLLLWKTTEPSKPHASVDCWRFAQKPVLDVWMRKIMEAAPA